MSRPFRFSAMLGDQVELTSLASIAKRSEDLGYSTLYFPDHFIDTEMAPTVAMATAAALTSTIAVGSCVLDVDYKHPAVVAKEIATIDALSGGRVELGIGAGWMRADYDALGLQFDRPGTRIARLAEAVEVIRGCWSEGPFSFEGEHYRISDYDATPSPARQRIPLLIGGGGPRLLRLAGQVADIVGINPNLRAATVGDDAMADSVADMIDRKVEWIREGAGDRFDQIELQIRYFIAAVTDDRHSIAELVAPSMGVGPEEALDAGIVLVGTIDEICDQMQERRERWGVSHAVIGGDQIDEFAPVVDRLAGT